MLRSWYLLCCFWALHLPGGGEADSAHYRERVKAMFYHAYNNYLENAFPYDELRPLTCDGQDTWGSFSLTLIDALDTLLILGNVSEFQRVVNVLQKSVDFDIDVNASVFETNIRVVGGLLSAHLLSKKAGVEVEVGWPCSGPLLRMAEEAARKLLPAFQTPTGMPYGTVNLLHGVNPGETPVTCTAGIGTFIVEFATLSHLTGDQVFEDVARKALKALWKNRSDIGLTITKPSATTQNLMIGTCGFKCTKGQCPCLSFNPWRPTGQACRALPGTSVMPCEHSSIITQFGNSLVGCLSFTTFPRAIQWRNEKDTHLDLIKDLRDHRLDNRMESFFLAETVKYLYLLFDPDNFIHNDGSAFDVVPMPYGECILGAGGYVFNTEAHPIDPAALHCCKKQKEEQSEVEELMREFLFLKRSKKSTFKRTAGRSGKESQTASADASLESSRGETNPQKNTKRRIPLLSCLSQPFNSKLAVLGQVFLDNT
ncbi:ER degradation-enhancing alpha-mannosidase-like protein 2 isoform X3 [Emydura macquarii macquarii]|uniref:ER degradation-enhancing alpha-mannosidase-like protein 2 isoform X3 n=1 Tax=Emydura macquarii macquarii TaxID=1129001 RepID=UPI00352A48F4